MFFVLWREIYTDIILKCLMLLGIFQPSYLLFDWMGDKPDIGGILDFLNVLP